MIKFVCLFVCLLEGIVWAYPEMTRHGYVNCISCHVSPTGGGILTEYGRELSRELLSSTGKEEESKFVYGVVKPPQWLNLGGDLRSLLLFRDTPTLKEGKVILMQADLEAIASYKKILLGGTFGYKQTRGSQPLKEHLISRRHYLNYRPLKDKNDELSFRGGKFQPAFGINIPDHAVSTKRGLGWDQGSETYNMEASWIGEKLNAYITGIFGRPDDKKLNREKGGAVSSSISFLDRFRAGVSYFYGKNDLAKRHVVGPFGILGFTEKLSLLSEWDFQGKIPKGSHNTRWGFVNYQKLDYELLQGFHGFLTQEFSKLDFSKPKSLDKVFGVGMQYFPRPHFELSLTYQWLAQSGSKENTDLFFLFHFYP